VRIGFLSTNGEWSGTARALLAAGRGLIARGHQVTFMVPHDSQLEQRFSSEGLSVLSFPARETMLAASFRLRALLGGLIDVVFVNSDREQLMAGIAIRLGAAAAIVRRTPAGVPISVKRLGFVARLARTAYLTTSAGEIRASELQRRSEPIVSDLGIRLDDFPPQPEPGAAQENEPAQGAARTILCHYNPTSRGRTAAAIRTLALLQPRHPDLHLAILGPGSDSEDLRMQAAALEVLPRVTFLGERDDALELMRDAFLGWVASDGDDAGYAFLDMMALGLPVIATDAAAAQRYVVPGITGFVIASGDSQTAAAIIAELLFNDSRRRAMGHAARLRVQREFREEDMIDGFEQAATLAFGRGR
jgi:glycosyltransferase involved in cell wall biosynthesis